MHIKISKKEWLGIGRRAGWLTGMKMKQICAWCGDLLNEIQDGREPLDKQLPDSHGLCISCAKDFLAEMQKAQGLTDEQVEIAMQKIMQGSNK